MRRSIIILVNFSLIQLTRKDKYLVGGIRLLIQRF